MRAITVGIVTMGGFAVGSALWAVIAGSIAAILAFVTGGSGAGIGFALVGASPLAGIFTAGLFAAVYIKRTKRTRAGRTDSDDTLTVKLVGIGGDD